MNLTRKTFPDEVKGGGLYVVPSKIMLGLSKWFVS